MGLKWIPFIWGLAEATLFFIVPDVGLSIIGREKLSKGIKACFFALIGALIGGAVMYGWGKMNPDSAFQTLEKVPGISQPMMEQAATEIQTYGLTGILQAPLKGRPYKIYAATAGQANISFAGFLLISIPARLLRFLAVTVLTHYAVKLVPDHKKARTRLIALCSGWILFYVFYFAKTGW
jgi:membrane protein YqaA with SNARE-associated domain